MKPETTKATLNKKGSMVDTQSESNNSINQLESYKNGDWLLTGKKPLDTLGAATGNGSGLDQGSSNMTSSALLSTFAAEQDKRIDFGLCSLFKKMKTGKDSKLKITENEIN